MTERQRPLVAVIGGGISGLATAHFLSDRDTEPRPRVVLLESEPRFGGKICTRRVGDCPVDLGPDSLLFRSEVLRQLLAELDLNSRIVAPDPAGSFVLSSGRLRPLPSGTVFGVPARMSTLLRSRLLSPLGLLRAAGDLVLPRLPLPDDPSVAQLLRPRLGRQVLDRLVEPLLGGVHAGHASLLSARSTIGEIEAIARRGRSIYLGLRGWRRRVKSSDPVLVGLDGGLEVLIAALTARLISPAHGSVAELRTEARVTGLSRDRDRYRIVLAGGGTVLADAVVLATPAFVSADLLTNLAPAAASALRGIEYAELASVTLPYHPAAVAHPMLGTGFLVPQSENRLLVGCSWLTSKWPQLSTSPKVIIKCMVGRHGEGSRIPASDDQLIQAVHAELSEIMGVTGPPPPAEVKRWPAGMPQYTVGHTDRIEQTASGLAGLPGLAVTGASYHGVGIASCLAQAQRTATAVLSSPAIQGTAP